MMKLILTYEVFMSRNLKKYLAEGIGTAILVLFGCGTAVYSGNIVATALAFGLAIVAIAYAMGDISGAHVNPAVSLAMLINKKLKPVQFGFYVLAQVLGALAGSLFLWAFIALTGSDKAITGLGQNQFGAFSAWGAFLVEVILTFVFVYAVLGVTSDKNKSHIAGLVIGAPKLCNLIFHTSF